MKIGKAILTFGNIEIEKNKFFCNKIPVHLRDVDIEKVLVSNKIYSGKKNLNTLLGTCTKIIKLCHYI